MVHILSNLLYSNKKFTKNTDPAKNILSIKQERKITKHKKVIPAVYSFQSIPKNLSINNKPTYKMDRPNRNILRELITFYFLKYYTHQSLQNKLLLQKE